MAPLRAARPWASFALAALLCSPALAQKVPSIDMKYCAAANSADMDPFYSDFQSDGRCFGNCTDLKYAFAIVQYKNCWCSNLIPNSADQKPLSDCELKCPGYPWDYCGGDGTFGYMEIKRFEPTGTAPPGGSATDPPSSTKGTATTPPAVQTVTVGGIVKTVTATPKPSTDDDAATKKSSSGLATGAIVGIVIGVIGGLAVLGAFLWLFLIRRRRQQEDAASNGLGTPIRGGGSPGMMATPKTEISENRFAGGAAAVGAGAASGWDTQTKRRSHLMPVDPRLDPYAKGIYAADQNQSRESFNSLQDNQDYSRRVHQAPRVLRATNPDPDVDN